MRIKLQLILLLLPTLLWAQKQDSARIQFSSSLPLVHILGVEVRPAHIFPTNPFLQGDNIHARPIDKAFSTHFKYAFSFRPGSLIDRIYGKVYQGAGIGYYSFGDSEYIGNPLAIYVFQGGRIAPITRKLSVDYEWNFGVSTGWKTYHPDYNRYNKMTGSKLNAYLNADFYLRWFTTNRLSLTAGISLSHFSNGNTSIPNAGMNTMAFKVGMDYRFGNIPDLSDNTALCRIPKFKRHVTYDVVFFGSWRRKGVETQDWIVPSPEAYPVFGFNFTPMYNLSRKLKTGISLDGVYDGSANIYTGDESGQPVDDIRPSDITRPELYQQFSLGLSGRIEYAMPFFTIGVGMGYTLLGEGDMKAFYQVATIKTALSRQIFLHAGYTLQEFSTPSFLMLGIGFRFNEQGLFR